MVEISDALIREAAYYIWKNEGCPEGLDFEHWVKAKAQLASKSDKECSKSACKTVEKKPAKKAAAKKATTAKKPAKK